MENIGDKVDNTPGASGELTASEYNDHKNELQEPVITSAQTLDNLKTPEQLSRSMYIYGTASQTMTDAAPSANIIELTPLTGASGLVTPDAYSQMDGLIVEFDKSTANTSTTVTVNFGQTGGTLLGAKSLKDPNGSDPGEGVVTGRCRIQFDVGNDWWILLDSGFEASSDVINSLYVSGGDVILDESVLFGTVITQQNLGTVGSLSSSAWYFCVIREDNLAVSLQALSGFSPTSPAGWSPTLASNQLDMLPFYDKEVDYCRYETGGNTYRILYVFKTNSTPDNIEPGLNILLETKPFTYVRMFESTEEIISSATDISVTLSSIDIDLLSEISGASNSRVYTAKQNDNINMYFGTYANPQGGRGYFNFYVDSVIEMERRIQNDANNIGPIVAMAKTYSLSKNNTLELKARRVGVNMQLNNEDSTRGTELIYMSRRIS